MENYFKTRNSINVNDHAEKKNGLTYLSWAWAWAEVKKLFPTATYTIYENADGCFYHTDGKTCWVKTGVRIEGIEHIEYLPVMDYRNASIPLDKVTSFDVNKAIQRSLTKAVARHGFGLYIYAGEDLPESEHMKPVQTLCTDCGQAIQPFRAEGALYSVEAIAKSSLKKYGRVLCAGCSKKQNEKMNEKETDKNA